MPRVMQVSQGRSIRKLADRLLGGVEIGGRSVAVVNDDLGLEVAGQFVEGGTAVSVGGVVGAQAVEEQVVDLAVVREQLGELGPEIRLVAIVTVRA